MIYVYYWVGMMMIYITEWGVDDICILLSGVLMIYITGWGVDDVYYWVRC